VRFACELRKRTLYARFLACLGAQLIDMGTPLSQRLQIAFTAAQRSAIAERAASSGQSLSGIVRQLVASALSFDTEAGPKADSPAALAALVAAEHAVLMVASILPEGERRMRELGSQAARAAEERLALVRDGEGEAMQ
jgi:hypothetical protein